MRNFSINIGKVAFSSFLALLPLNHGLTLASDLLLANNKKYKSNNNKMQWNII